MANRPRRLGEILDKEIFIAVGDKLVRADIRNPGVAQAMMVYAQRELKRLEKKRQGK